MARRPTTQRRGRSKAANRRRAGLWRRRTGRLGRLIAVILVLGAAIAGTRQSELFYPVDEAFERALYPHWIDADGDCRDTRAEVLAAESLTPVRYDGRGCKVVAGRWFDPFTGRTLTDPSMIDIDHRVPLAEAHRSGAHR